jgi:hypothetical protein
MTDVMYQAAAQGRGQAGRPTGSELREEIAIEGAYYRDGNDVVRHGRLGDSYASG